MSSAVVNLPFAEIRSDIADDITEYLPVDAAAALETIVAEAKKLTSVYAPDYLIRMLTNAVTSLDFKPLLGPTDNTNNASISANIANQPLPPLSTDLQTWHEAAEAPSEPEIEVSDPVAPTIKLDLKKARVIRERAAAGEPALALAKEHGVTIWAILDVLAHRTWKEKPSTPSTKNTPSNVKLDWDKVDEIRHLYQKEGLSIAAIGHRFAVTPQTVHAVVTNRSWVRK